MNNPTPTPTPATLALAEYHAYTKCRAAYTAYLAARDAATAATAARCLAEDTARRMVATSRPEMSDLSREQREALEQSGRERISSAAIARAAYDAGRKALAAYDAAAAAKAALPPSDVPAPAPQTPAPFAWNDSRLIPHPPKTPGKPDYEQIRCLVVYCSTIEICFWNCQDLFWEDEDGDDFRHKADDVSHWAIMPLLPNGRAG